MAKVNSSTGVVTGTAAGTATITGRWSYDTSKTVTYTVNVTEIPSGTYFILNRQYKKYIQPDNDDAPNYSNNGGIMEQMDFDGGDYQRWIFTHTGDGYYKITSKKSGYAITVPSGEETAADINLILTTYTGTNNQKWKITKTTNGSYKIKAKSSESYAAKDLVLDVQAYIVTQNLNIQQREYLDNDSFGDEWWLDTMLPVSGSEISYNPDIWNFPNVANNVAPNCYSYALNTHINPKTNQVERMQPGESVGYELSGNNLSASTVVSYVQADASAYGFVFEVIGKYDVCPSGSYKVALVIAPGQDYHWYRQDPDGYWSHKRGYLLPTREDASGCPIYDPAKADRDYSQFLMPCNYSEFVGYFKVTPINNLFSTAVSSPMTVEDYEAKINQQCVAVKPSREIANMIATGMSYSRVTELLDTQGQLITSGLFIVEYELDDGGKLTVEYVSDLNGQYVVASVW